MTDESTERLRDLFPTIPPRPWLVPHLLVRRSFGRLRRRG
jgi:hypothetical protein